VNKVLLPLVFAIAVLGSATLAYAVEGAFVTSIDGSDGAGTKFIFPNGVATDTNNRIITIDSNLDLVQIYDSTGTFVTSFDGSDGAGTKFISPFGVATDTNDRIIVTDSTLNLVQIYDSTGTFVTSFDGSDGAGTAFAEPFGVATDTNDRIIVVDKILDLVQIYDSTGTFVTSFDGSDGAGTLFLAPFGVATDTNDRIIVVDIFLALVQIYDDLPPPSSSSGGGGGSDQQWKTKPTFGLDHNTFRPLVDGGFSFNGVSHDITDNWWTPFAEQKVKIGTINSFTAKAYADKQLRVQEFLFGIPEVGDANKAELGIEIVYDYSGEIDRINVVQKTDIIDIDSIKVVHSKSKCQSDDTVKRCDTTRLSMIFLEPIQDKIMAIKAIDFKNRVHITYLNEGFDISGKSLNPMNTKMIPSTEKYEGLVEVTQTAKYSNIWTTQDDREFEMNKSGSFKQINQSFERHIDTGTMKNRMHSAFADYKETQANLASSMMPLYYHTSINHEESFSEINDIFAYEYPETFGSILDNQEIQNKMLIQAQKAQKIMNHLIDPSFHLK